MSLKNLCDLFFEFSNEDRLKILKTIQKQPKTITALSNELDLTTQEISRNLSRLGDIGLTYKNPSGAHSLTSYGELSLKQLLGFKFITSHKEYFQNHELSNLPTEFIFRLGELEVARYIDDVMVILHLIDELIKEAEEYVWRITDRYIITIIPSWNLALNRGIKARLLEPSGIIIPPEFERGSVIERAINEQRFLIRTLEKVPLFMSLNEKKVAGICFPSKNGRIDYRGFVSNDPKVLNWAKDLYLYLWNRSKPRPIV